MKRVLYIDPSARIGGAEQSLLDLLERLPADRYQAHLMIPGEGPLADAARRAGVRVVIQSWPAGLVRTGREATLANRLLAPLGLLQLAPVIRAAARYVRSERIDLIHTNGTKAHLIGAGAKALSRARLVWHVRDVLAPGSLRSALVMLSRRGPDLIVANSGASAESMGGTRRDRVQIVYNGLDLERFSPVREGAAKPRPPGIPGDAFVVGAVGALAPLKGHLHLIRAMARVMEQAPESRLVIVGEEMYETRGHAGHRRLLEEEIARLDGGGRMILAGRINDMPAAYRTMDLLVLPSVRPESFGRVLIEAMACGVPVITTDLGGPREIVTSADLGLLVPPADPDALASAILSLYHDPLRCRRLAAEGRRAVVERFSVGRYVAEIGEIYDRLIRPDGLRVDDVVERTAR